MRYFILMVLLFPLLSLISLITMVSYKFMAIIPAILFSLLLVELGYKHIKSSNKELDKLIKVVGLLTLVYPVLFIISFSTEMEIHNSLLRLVYIVLFFTFTTAITILLPAILVNIYTITSKYNVIGYISSVILTLLSQILWVMSIIILIAPGFR